MTTRLEKLPDAEGRGKAGVASAGERKANDRNGAADSIAV